MLEQIEVKIHQDFIPMKDIPSIKSHEDIFYESKVYAVTIGKPQFEVFSFWRDFSNLSLFMKDIKSVELLANNYSLWRAETDLGTEIEWQSRIILEIPCEMISWTSANESEVENSGTVWFSPAPQSLGTIVKLIHNLKIPMGKPKDFLLNKVGYDSGTLNQINLRRLKAYLETGEIPTVMGQPSGRDKSSYEIIYEQED